MIEFKPECQICAYTSNSRTCLFHDLHDNIGYNWPEAMDDEKTPVVKHIDMMGKAPEDDYDYWSKQ